MALFIGGSLIGLALALVIAQALPSKPKLGPALARIGATGTVNTAESRTLEARVGGWVIQRLPSLRGFTIPERDLALVGISTNKFIFNKSAAAAAGFVFVILFGLMAQAVNLVPFAIPAFLALIAAALGWFLPDLFLRDKAVAARKEFVRNVAVYLELVAAERRRGAPPAIALEVAASIGKSWAFVRINQELTRARYDHTQPWDALLTLSKDIDVPELGEAAKIVRLSGDEGASVYEALRSAGQGMRIKMLNEEHTLASQATAKVSMLTTVLALVFGGVLLTPLLLNLI